MITSTGNKKVKWLVSLTEKSKERKKEQVFVVEGTKMFEEADERYICEVYVSESYIEKNNISEKLQRVGYETVTDEVFKKNTHMLETNSKSGSYALYCAYSVYSTRA